MPKLKDITLPVAILGCVAVPSICALLYFLIDRLIDAGENLGGIVVAVVTILGALGIQSARNRHQLDRVEKLANGNLHHERQARMVAQEQALHLAIQAPPGTYVPSVPVVVPVAPADERARGDAGHV